MGLTDPDDPSNHPGGPVKAPMEDFCPDCGKYRPNGCLCKVPIPARMYVPEYVWLLMSTTDNGLDFYTVFATRDLAVAHVEDQAEVTWHTDASGNMWSIESDGYTYRISAEPFHTGEVRDDGGGVRDGAV